MILGGGGADNYIAPSIRTPDNVFQKKTKWIILGGGGQFTAYLNIARIKRLQNKTPFFFWYRIFLLFCIFFIGKKFFFLPLFHRYEYRRGFYFWCLFFGQIFYKKKKAFYSGEWGNFLFFFHTIASIYRSAKDVDEFWKPFIKPMFLFIFSFLCFTKEVSNVKEYNLAFNSLNISSKKNKIHVIEQARRMKYCFFYFCFSRKNYISNFSVSVTLFPGWKWQTGKPVGPQNL